jgi:hypothetical protein
MNRLINVFRSWATRTVPALAVGLLLPGAVGAEVLRPSAAELALAQREVDKLLVVDCLLPGQVRRLGAQMTYLTPRRPAKLSVDECGLRGGEYVMYDRANLSSALATWLPMAEQGDQEAQTYVGEVYERGIGGTPPQYAEAAAWYRKAADQGYPRAMINLGFLYEKGLGVEQDSAAALSLYRKAAGLGDSIALDSAGTAERDARIRALQQELEATRQQLDKAREQLRKQEGASRSELQGLEEQIRKAQAAGQRDDAARLQDRLQAVQARAEASGRKVTELTASIEQYRRQLDQLKSETASLKELLEQARQRSDEVQAELDARRARADQNQRELQALKERIEHQQSGDSQASHKLAAQLKLREEELARQRTEIARVEAEARDYKQKLAALEAKRAKADAGGGKDTRVAIAPPSIQLIDPAVVLTRSPTLIKVRGQAPTRELVGKVTAPAGLLSFTINDVARQTDDRGLFKASIPLNSGKTEVSLIAVDRRGERAELSFILVPEGAGEVAPPRVPPYIAGLKFGRYHALVVGNQDYKLLPRLDTAVADAKAVAKVLTDKYGFSVTLLTNATRYQTLSALNKLRSELNEHDNLLIYYAGHGEIDRANLRGYWLPVDAEPSSDANWISNATITDFLNAIAVKHALVVADSCYSGTLTRSSIGQLTNGVSEEARVKWLKAIIDARARTVLTSGGIQPVMDGGGGSNSVFARTFIDVLAENDDALEAQRLYREVAARVLDKASRFRVEQRPEYAPLKFAGHESGDFLFVPVKLLAKQ